MAGLIGESSSTRTGLQSAGLGFTSANRNVSANSSFTISCQGLLFIRMPYAWSGFELWYCSDGFATKLTGASFAINISVESSVDSVTIKNTASATRAIEVVYQKIPKIG